MPHCYTSLDSEAVEASGYVVPEPIPNEHTVAGAPEVPDQHTQYSDSLKDSASCLRYISHVLRVVSIPVFKLLLLITLMYNCHGFFIIGIRGKG